MPGKISPDFVNSAYLTVDRTGVFKLHVKLPERTLNGWVCEEGKTYHTENIEIPASVKKRITFWSDPLEITVMLIREWIPRGCFLKEFFGV